MTRTAVFTICARNYVHFATTLFQSTLEHHPDWDRYLIVVDDGIDEQGAESGLFKVILADALDIPNKSHFFFQYKLLELCTAVKPWAFEHLISHLSYERVIYLDPDIRLYSPLVELESLFDAGNGIIFTPHLTGPLDDGGYPSEREILLSGSWNLGFCAIDNSLSAQSFIQWWQKRLERHCVVDIARGYFVDQKWCDLVPGLFSNFAPLRHEGYNTAYWNLPHRKLQFARASRAQVGARTALGGNDRQVMVNDVPLRFFHFSGFSPEYPTKLSIHENRDSLGQSSILQFLVAEYSKQLFRNGYDHFRNQRNYYSEFRDGEKIADATRRTFLKRALEGAPLLPDDVDPFERSDFCTNPSLSNHPYLTFTLNMLGVWNARVDLQEAFPDPECDDLQHFLEWLVNHGESEGALPSKEIARTRRELEIARELALNSASAQTTEPQVAAPPEPIALSEPTAVRRPVWHQRAKRRFKQYFLNRVGGKAPEISSEIPALQSLTPVTERAHEESHSPSESSPSESRLQELAAFEFGVKLVGYFAAVSGVGQSIRGCASALAAAEIPFSVDDLACAKKSPQNPSGKTGANRQAESRYPINLFHVNADSIVPALAAMPPSDWQGRYNIGFWHWEMPRLPEKFAPSYENLDEVWTCSNFVRDAITELRDVPVSVIPHPVSPPNRLKSSREDFGLPSRRFLFLAMCDFFSYAERKNPFAAIRAFAELDAEKLGIGLVVKVLNSYWDSRAALKIEAMVKDLPYCYVLDETLTREQVWNLQYSCDSFVSLHRSEGFGLGIAEHMALGKPVVATNWSGNVDMMTAENSCPVDYRLVELQENLGPYEKGGIWAEPDIFHAASFMERLASDPEYYGTIGERGREYALTHLSPAAIGARYRREFERILGRPASEKWGERLYANCA